ncbi:MAG TPA: Crp/Fnr family transcriptional regulator [Wenzhouxiangellaceae bacterium]|nr:Crp/Fnr family transcriptional regulator [Wenzhouxiangellaceae bacterium]
MNEVEKQDLLRRADLFSTLSQQSIEQLAAGSQTSSFARKSPIARAGTYSPGIRLIRSGLVKLSIYSQQGQEKVIAMLDRDKAFGQAEIFSGQPFHYEAHSISKVELLTVSRDTVQRVSQTDARFNRALVECLSRQFDALVRDIKYANGYTVSQRLVSFLLYRAEAQSDKEAMVDLAFTKTALASRLGMSPESFSRTLRYLQDRGLITVRVRRIRINDVQALSNLLAESLRDGTCLMHLSSDRPYRAPARQH